MNPTPATPTPPQRSKDLRVAVLTSYFPTSAEPWQGHSAFQTLRILSTLCDLHVFCPVTRYPSLLARRVKALPIDLTWRPPATGGITVSVTYVPFTALPIVSRPLNGLSMARTLEPHVRAFAPDVIFNYVVYPPGFAAVRLGRTLKTPVVLTAIGSDLNRIPDRLVGRLTRAALRGANAVTTVSSDLARTAVRLGADPTRTRAILNGCDTAIFHPRDRSQARHTLGLLPGASTTPGWPNHREAMIGDPLQSASEPQTTPIAPLPTPDAPMILYVGRLDLRKGLLELLEAVAALRAARPGLRCFLLGEGPARPALQAAIGTHNAADTIHLLPAAPTATVAQWMAAADLVTLPSYMEGCPNVVIEALSSGRPVVATDVGGIPELMHESGAELPDNRSGRLIPPRDPAALRNALDEVLSQTWNAEAIASQHARSWTDVAHELLPLLEQVASRNLQ